jgi:putative ABC transport system permease protein
MLTPNRLLRRFRSLFTTQQHDHEMDEELRFHIEMEATKRVRAGMSERDAFLSAQRDLGNVPRHLDDARDARGVRPLEDFVQDVRVAARTLGRQRTFAIVAILTLAIGIGSTTALWSAVYRVLFEPYPFVESHRIVSVQQVLNATDDGEFAPGNFIDVRQRARSFEMLGAAEPWSVDWVGPDGPEVFEAALVTQDVFPIQGLSPIIGRTFVPDEFVAGRDQVALLSESLWRGRFGADSSIVGRTMVLDTMPRVIVGVMPEEALAPYDAEVWLPKIFRPDDLRSRGNGYWTVIGRLAPGATLEQANAEMRGVGAQLVSEFPAENRGMAIKVVSLRDAIVGNSRGGLLMLLASVFFVLLIACVNVTSLQLAESVRRRRELAVRTAIGAGRGRLVRQLLAENVLLAFIGASAGLLIAKWGISVIRILAPDSLWQLRTLTFGQPALLFAFAVAFVTALVVAMVPVFSLGRLDTAQPLAGGGGSRAGVSLARRRANRVLVVSEVALALMLLVGAGLLVRSLATLLRVDRGFRTDHVLVVTAQTWSYYPTRPLRAEFVRQTVERLGAIPGIERVGMTSSLPLSYPIGFERPRVTVEGQAVAPGDEVPSVIAAATTPGYFSSLDIPLRSGRQFTATDNESAPPVAIVNQAFVRRYFPNTDPLGKRISLGFMGPPAPREIVGVVGDIRHEELHSAPEPNVYVPHPQAATGAIHFVMRTTGDPAAMERRVRDELRAINGSMPLSAVTTMEAQLSDSLRQRRFQLGLLAAFSLTALVLAAIGIYGVMSRATSERTHEIGLRMAVGARATDVRWMVLRNGGTLATIGIAIGAVGASLLTRYLSGMLFGVSAYDPITYLLAGGVLLATAVLATWLPAWRASRVDPVVALRND